MRRAPRSSTQPVATGEYTAVAAIATGAGNTAFVNAAVATAEYTGTAAIATGAGNTAFVNAAVATAEYTAVAAIGSTPVLVSAAVGQAAYSGTAAIGVGAGAAFVNAAVAAAEYAGTAAIAFTTGGAVSVKRSRSHGSVQRHCCYRQGSAWIVRAVPARHTAAGRQRVHLVCADLWHGDHTAPGARYHLCQWRIHGVIIRLLRRERQPYRAQQPEERTHGCVHEHGDHHGADQEPRTGDTIGGEVTFDYEAASDGKYQGTFESSIDLSAVTEIDVEITAAQSWRQWLLEAAGNRGHTAVVRRILAALAQGYARVRVLLTRRYRSKTRAGGQRPARTSTHQINRLELGANHLHGEVPIVAVVKEGLAGQG